MCQARLIGTENTTVSVVNIIPNYLLFPPPARGLDIPLPHPTPTLSGVAMSLALASKM